VIESLTGQGFSEREACRAVGVNRSSYAYWRKRPPNQRELRRAWLEPLVAKVHADSFGTYGYVRVAAELRLGHGVIANHKLVYSIMRKQGLKGLPKRPAGRRGPIGALAADLVRRDFSEDGPDKQDLAKATASVSARTSTRIICVRSLGMKLGCVRDACQSFDATKAVAASADLEPFAYFMGPPSALPVIGRSLKKSLELAQLRHQPLKYGVVGRSSNG
jgi:helix-turn-helix protein